MRSSRSSSLQGGKLPGSPPTLAVRRALRRLILAAWRGSPAESAPVWSILPNSPRRARSPSGSHFAPDKFPKRKTGRIAGGREKATRPARDRAADGCQPQHSLGCGTWQQPFSPVSPKLTPRCSYSAEGNTGAVQLWALAPYQSVNATFKRGEPKTWGTVALGKQLYGEGLRVSGKARISLAPGLTPAETSCWRHPSRGNASVCLVPQTVLSLQ